MKYLLPFIMLSFAYVPDLRAESVLSEPNLELGARTFISRCSLCHGSEGYGDGLLAVSLKDYPHTNLHENKFGQSESALRQSIREGGSQGRISEAMPPWEDELNSIEIDSLVMFIRLMLQSPQKIKSLIDGVAVQPSVANGGSKLYQGYCSLCHGKEGKGDGKMARIIKNPPPFDLTQSRVPVAYLKQIIELGGDAMGRSERMPPWQEQFTKIEIETIIQYLLSIRSPE